MATYLKIRSELQLSIFRCSPMYREVFSYRSESIKLWSVVYIDSNSGLRSTLSGKEKHQKPKDFIESYYKLLASRSKW